VPNWDENSSELFENLMRAAKLFKDEAQRRDDPSLAAIKKWHAVTMHGLSGLKHLDMAGGFRGEPNLDYQVWVHPNEGVAPENVAAELDAWIERFRAGISILDEAIPAGAPPLDTKSLRGVVKLAAWAHAEWVRIHPFCNGNGRTARMIANYVFLRYALPPCVQLRPRPEEAIYAVASAEAMRKKDNYELTYELFLKWVIAHLEVWRRREDNGGD